MALRDREIYRVTNPIFLENSRSFLSTEPGERDLETEPAFRLAYRNAPRTIKDTHDIEPKDHDGFDNRKEEEDGVYNSKEEIDNSRDRNNSRNR